MPCFILLILLFSGGCEAPQSGGEKALNYSESFLSQLNHTYRAQNIDKLGEISFYLDSLPPQAQRVHELTQNLDQWIDSLKNRILQTSNLSRLSRVWLHKESASQKDPVEVLIQKLQAYQTMSQQVAQKDKSQLLKPIRFDAMLNPLWSDSLSSLNEFIRLNFSTPQRTLLSATLTGLSYQTLKWEQAYLQSLREKVQIRISEQASDFQVKVLLGTKNAKDSLSARVFLSPPEWLAHLARPKRTLQKEVLPFWRGWGTIKVPVDTNAFRIQAGICYRHRSNYPDSCWQTHKVYVLDTLAQAY